MSGEDALVIPEDATPLSYEGLVRLLVLSEDCLTDDFSLQTDGAAVFAAVKVNDFFWWGTADVEEFGDHDLDQLAKSYDDIRELAPLNNSGHPSWEYLRWAPQLFAARQRKMRPQGAFYSSIPKPLWRVFDKCGAERAVDIGNPHAPGGYETIGPSSERQTAETGS